MNYKIFSLFKRIIYLLLLSVVAATLLSSVSAAGVDHYLSYSVTADAQKPMTELNYDFATYRADTGYFYSNYNNSFYYGGDYGGDDYLSFTVVFYDKNGDYTTSEINMKDNTPSGGVNNLRLLVPGDTRYILIVYNSGVWDRSNGNPFTEIAPGKNSAGSQRYIFVNFADFDSVNGGLPTNLEFYTSRDNSVLGGLYHYQMNIIGGSFTN
ncbi:MAG: hypothetical protein LBT10_06640 [Methanobrevibacter sp.]|jgi:hypothetical protein|nr:hypothetical protein [Methanobrevibacter sp.]